MDIYIFKDGQQNGPVSVAEVNSQLASGTMTESDLAWVEGWAEWQPLASVPGIVKGVKPPPLPSASVQALSQMPVAGVQPAIHLPWYKRTWVHVVLFIFFPYVQIPLMWICDVFKQKTRIVLTVAGCIWIPWILLASNAQQHASKKITVAERSVAREANKSGLVGLSASEAFDRGEQTAKKMYTQTVMQALMDMDGFNSIRASNGLPPVTQGNLARVISGSLPDEFVGDELSKSAEEEGIDPAVVEQFLAGWKSGVKKLRHASGGGK